MIHTGGRTSVIVCYDEQFFSGAQESSFESVVCLSPSLQELIAFYISVGGMDVC